MSEASERVLMIDDDIRLCKLVTRFLGAGGFEVHTVQNGTDGIERALSDEFSLTILDIGLPGMSGFEVLQEIRSVSQAPVLILTAHGNDGDRIQGLEMGADDYLAKPFYPRELTARIRAILRRSTANAHKGIASGPIKVGELELHPGSRAVWLNRMPIDLTTVEFDLLQKLLKCVERIVSREELVEEVLGRRFSPFDRSIDTHVYNLRKKLGSYPNGTDRIKAIRGVGYLFAQASSQA